MSASKTTLEQTRHHLEAMTALLGESERDILAHASKVQAYSKQFGKQINEVMSLCRSLAFAENMRDSDPHKVLSSRMGRPNFNPSLYARRGNAARLPRGETLHQA
jgi:hypothetical protein